MARNQAVVRILNDAHIAAAEIQPPVLEGRELLESMLSPEQVDACEDFAALVAHHRASDRAFKVEALEIVKRIAPRPLDYAAWQAAKGAIVDACREAEKDTYANKCLIAAYKEIHGDLPTAGEGTGNGSKGMSPKRAALSLQTRAAKVVDYMATVEALDINAAQLARVRKAVEAMAVAIDAMVADL